MKINVFYAFALSAMLGFSPVSAQETTEATTDTNTATTQTEATAETSSAENGLSLGEETQQQGPQVGQRYAKEEFGDWLIQCIKTENGNDPCNMFQLLRDADNNPVAEVVMQPLQGAGQAVAGANVVTPLETLLTAQLSIAVDKGKAKRYPFAFCTQQGCVSRIGLTGEDLQRFKRGNVATVVMVPAGAPDTPVSLSMSLAGFTAAFNSLAK